MPGNSGCKDIFVIRFSGEMVNYMVSYTVNTVSKSNTLFVGPYYKYRTYIDMLRHKNPDSIDSNTPFWARIKWAPVYGIVFIACSLMFSIKVSFLIK